MTVHVATVHHRDGRFVGLQLDALERHMSEPFETWTILDEVESDRFNTVIPSPKATTHGPRLDALAHAIIREAAGDDVILFLDGDAWLVADPCPAIRAGLAESGMVAVRRDEAPGGPWPHPLFCAVTVRSWWDLRASWEPETWADPNVKLRYDVGAGAGRRLLEEGRTFTPLLRLNTVNPHPLFFAVYGDDQPLVYHHGAGFRRKFSHASRPGDTIEDIQRLSDEILERAQVDPEFWREFLA